MTGDFEKTVIEFSTYYSELEKRFEETGKVRSLQNLDRIYEGMLANHDAAVKFEENTFLRLKPEVVMTAPNLLFFDSTKPAFLEVPSLIYGGATSEAVLGVESTFFIGPYRSRVDSDSGIYKLCEELNVVEGADPNLYIHAPVSNLAEVNRAVRTYCGILGDLGVISKDTEIISPPDRPTTPAIPARTQADKDAEAKGAAKFLEDQAGKYRGCW